MRTTKHPRRGKQNLKLGDRLQNFFGIKLCDVTNNARIEQLLEIDNTTTSRYHTVHRSLQILTVNLLAHQKINAKCVTDHL